LLEPGLFSHLLTPNLTEKQRDVCEKKINDREAELDQRFRALSKDLLDGAFDVEIKTRSRESFNLKGNSVKK